MIDINLIREKPDIIRKDLEKRNDTEKLKWIDDILKKDEEWKKLKGEADQLRQARNNISKDINKAKKEGKDVKKILKEAAAIPKKIEKVEEKQQKLMDDIKGKLMRLPNILHKDVPKGESEEDNVTVKEVGKKPKFKFEAKSHVDLMEMTDTVDLERAAKTSGARFYFLKNELVLLEQAIMKLAMDKLFRKGYQIIEPPYMINRKSYEGVTDLEDFEDVIYKIEDEDLYMIATSEHAIGSMHQDEILDENSLPLKYAGVSACFRKEAGAHGKDTKGIFRVHQFNKIEQFIFCTPEQAHDLHEELLANAEEFFKALKLPYRVVNICTADMGTVAAKKYDLEVWMPVQGKYREAVSCSDCTDYQARRLRIRYRNKENKNVAVYTLNSTLVALTRALVAVLENYQQEDGSIKVPDVLQEMVGFDVIKKK